MKSKENLRALGITLTVLMVILLLSSMLPVLDNTPPIIADILPAEQILPIDTVPPGNSVQVTLITGDVVNVITADGERSFSISPAKPEKLGQHFTTWESEEGTYIIPDGIDLEKLDMELFNIDYLIEEQYNEQASLPLLVKYQPELSQPEVQSLESKFSTLGLMNQMVHKEITTLSARLAYGNASNVYTNLVTEPDVEKIWLDKKAHTQLAESIPIINADSWWGSGFDGSGVSIAVLDTGIDSTHPALDDLDDNPGTTDPKVLVDVNFTDDADSDDYYGHGTHVAGIAAGTYAGSPYQGVAPGANLWNIKVLNQYGYGYDSWIINGINYASLGPDGIEATGDEADIINMSLGNSSLSDGTDPLSQAVNLAVDRGVVVVVSAGNSGPGPMTIGAPGVAEKAITVGATNKDDTLASYSSRGPTIDSRIKPDIVAPGSSITSSLPGGTYEAKSGTSMAAPHVAGAAALLLDRVDSAIPAGLSRPQFVKDAFISSATLLPESIFEQGGGRLDLSDCWGAGASTEIPIPSESLTWNNEPIPYTMLNAITPGKTIYDFAVAADHLTMYAACGESLYQSTNGGTSWTDIYYRLPAASGNVTFVAIAPDDPNIIVTASVNLWLGTTNIAISINGGTTFTNMAFPTSYTQTIRGVAVSPMVTGGFRYIAAYGQDAAANAAVLYYYNYGSGVGGWRNAVTQFTTPPAAAATMDNIVALTFSPNFASDYMAVVLSEQTGGTTAGALLLHALSFNSLEWDTVVSTGYPVTVTSEALAGSAFNVNSASVALGPDYMGGDDTLRIAFVGADITALTATGGIWRCNDVSAARHLYNTAGINSVAFDGTSLAAGAYATNNVYHCADPLASSPTVLGARSFKRIGVDDAGNDMVQVMFIGETLYGAKRGVSGAMSKSLDAGTTWNDFTLINMSLTSLDDILVSMDGATRYLAAHDTNLSAVFRMSPIQRVLCVTNTGGNPDFMLRGLDSEPDVVYAADKSGTTLYYSADGGVSRWQQRLNVPAAMADLAVEAPSVIYFGSGVNIYKSINSGFTWNIPVNTTATGNVFQLLSLGENKLLISTAGSSSNILYSTDGGATWTSLLGIIGGASAHIAATGLEPNDYIFAAPGGSNSIHRFKVGTPGLGEFENLNVPITEPGYGIYGLALHETSLFALGTDGVNSRCWWSPDLIQSIPPPPPPTTSTPTPTPIPTTTTPPSITSVSWYTIYSEGTTFNQSPHALVISHNKLWAIDTSGSHNLYSCVIAAVSSETSDLIVSPASLSLGSFGLGEGTANGTLDFISGLDAHEVILTASLVDTATGLINYSSHVSLSSDNFSILANGSQEVSIEIDLNGLPSAVYEGRITAVIDGDSQRTIHAIFGFVKSAKINVHKIDINGNPAQNHKIWAIHITDPNLTVTAGITDASGNVTFDALGDNLHIISYGYDENQVSIWTVSENITVTDDTNIVLDERDTRVIDFNPNKSGQIASAKMMDLVFVENNRYARWSSGFWYPESYTFRVSPISTFDAFFNYNYYPQDDYVTSTPINTDVWHNPGYLINEITGNITFVADYNNMVHRHSNYGVAIDEEMARWYQIPCYQIGIFSFGSGFMYSMNAPQARWEWLSPTPTIYRDYYSSDNWSWEFNGSARSYPQSSVNNWGIGTHPLTSGTNVNVQDIGGGTSILDLYGNIFQDVSGNDFYNNQVKFPGEITVLIDGVHAFSGNISSSYGIGFKCTGTPSFTVNIQGTSSLPLSRQILTQLDFTANFTQDYRPPRLYQDVQGMNLYGIAPNSEINVAVLLIDDSPIAERSLSYSLDDGANWYTAGPPTDAGGNIYIFNLGQISNSFVDLKVEASDTLGNHILQTTGRAFYVGTQSVDVSVSAVDTVAEDDSFTASINISEIVDLNAAQYDILFDSTVLELTGFSDGMIGTTPIPIPTGETAPQELAPGHWRVVQSLGLSSVSGSGNLSELHFHVIGPDGSYSDITLMDGLLSDIGATEIPATWTGHRVDVSILRGDANEDGVVNALDMTKVARIILQLDPSTPGADCNCDENIDVRDMTSIARKILGLD